MLKRSLAVTLLLCLALGASRAQQPAFKPEFEAWGAYAASFKATVELFAGAELKAAAFSPDGKWIATSGPENALTLWDARKGEKVTRLEGHADAVTCLAFSPDSALLASGSADSQIRLWDVAAAKLKQTLAGHTKQVNCLAFSANGEWLASGSADSTVRTWQLGTDRSVSHDVGRWRRNRDAESTESFTAVGWSGNEVLGGTDSNSRYRWQRDSVDPHSISTTSNKETVVAIGSLTGGGHDYLGRSGGSVEFTGASNTGNHSFSLGSRLVGMAIPSHSMVAWVASSSQLHVYPLQFAEAKEEDRMRGRRTNLQKYRSLDTGLEDILTVECSFDGSALLLADKTGKIEVWTTDTPRPDIPAELVARLDDMLPRKREAIRTVRAAPNGKLVAAGFDDGSVKLWDGQGEVKAVLAGAGKPHSLLQWSADGRKLLTWDGARRVCVWQAANAQLATELELQGKVTGLSASPGLEYLVAGTDKGEVQVWDVALRQVSRKLQGFEESVKQVAWSADGNHIAACAGKLVRAYDVGEMLELPDNSFEAPLLLGFTSDAVAVLVGKQLELRGWGDEPLKASHTLAWSSSPQTQFVLRGDRLALASGRSAAVFRTSDGKLVATVSSGADITALDFDNDGRLVTGGIDGQLRFWKLP